MTPKFPLKELVEVEWVDSAARGRWGSVEEYRKHDVVTCRTAGYLLSKTKRAVTIIQSQHTDDGLSDAMSIPTCAVLKLRRLK
jgi:hypothetical protein